MEENIISTKDVLAEFPPREEPHWTGRSFGLAFFPVIAVLFVATFLGGALKDWSDGTFSPGLLAVPAGLIVAALLSAALRIRSGVVEKLQAGKAAARILGTLTKGGGESLEEISQLSHLHQAFLKLVLAFGKVLRNNTPQEELLGAVDGLTSAYGAEKAATINGALPKLCESLVSVSSQTLRRFPSAVSAAFWVFLAVVMMIPVFSDAKGLPATSLATMILVYAFSLIFFVSKNIIQVFGTMGSQIRVSDTIKDLLGPSPYWEG